MRSVVRQERAVLAGLVVPTVLMLIVASSGRIGSLTTAVTLEALGAVLGKPNRD